eukprot:CAMPEP_0182899376 /NCGR_PEP_ID=MMETSP0034_2-20130328/28042_1 /TAXON_ID=156128 /ORGANISM="Nephroselmis pyriformis, Strain CCMP717" /LENGTH=170 /DNA_ID=CAMNT_0025033403 /DNA_START=29 /DNA_END=541 /DNA_ORIENTATION=+
MAPLVGVTKTIEDMEYSVHEVPRKHMDEMKTMFKGDDLTGMLIVPTCQKSALDVVRVGDEIEEEKDRLLERFVEWAKGVTDKLIEQGHWADYIDPCSGLAMVNRENRSVYGEVNALEVLLGYKTSNAGCCKVVLHPQWGSSVYPATMFTKAPLADLQAAIKAVEIGWKGV